MNISPGYNNPYNTSQIPTYGYGGYYNPYLEKKRQEEQRRIQEQQQGEQNKILEKMMRISLKFQGMPQEEIDSTIRMRMHQEPQTELEINIRKSEIANNEGHMYNNLSKMQQEQDKREYEEKLRIQEEERNKTKNMGMCEYFETIASETLLSIKENETTKTKRDLTNIYNQSSYSKMLKNKNDVDIDDLEITLPEHVRNSYDEETEMRRKRFLEAVLK